MYALRMVVLFLFAILPVYLTSTVNYISTDNYDNGDNKETGQFGGNITKRYNNANIHSADGIEQDNIRYHDDKRSNRNKWSGKSLRQGMSKVGKQDIFNVSYPPVEYRLFKTMLNKDLCDQYTLECIYYRAEYPQVDLSVDRRTGVKYNPCHRFVEPCFGISENDYKAIKKFKNLKDYY